MYSNSFYFSASKNLTRFSHDSFETKTKMTCAVYIPDGVTSCPALLYLSGLTCTDENFCQKSGIFRELSKKTFAFIAPDTSPRNDPKLPG